MSFYTCWCVSQLRLLVVLMLSIKDLPRSAPLRQGYPEHACNNTAPLAIPVRWIVLAISQICRGDADGSETGVKKLFDFSQDEPIGNARLDVKLHSQGSAYRAFVLAHGCRLLLKLVLCHGVVTPSLRSYSEGLPRLREEECKSPP